MSTFEKGQKLVIIGNDPSNENAEHDYEIGTLVTVVEPVSNYGSVYVVGPAGRDTALEQWVMPHDLRPVGEVFESLDGRVVRTTAAEPEPEDVVNSPSHYTAFGAEVIDITEHLNFNMGNAVKYIARADLKGKPIEDLRKALWYLERELRRRGEA